MHNATPAEQALFEVAPKVWGVVGPLAVVELVVVVLEFELVVPGTKLAVDPTIEPAEVDPEVDPAANKID